VNLLRQHGFSGEFDGVKAKAQTRDRQLAEIIGRDSWTIEGVYHQWRGPSFDRAELILAIAAMKNSFALKPMVRYENLQRYS
jgi:hypothetical protein